VTGSDQIYFNKHYAKRRQNSFKSESHEIVDTLVEQFQSKSVIGFGYTVGTYLERFAEHGVTVHGVEENTVASRHAVVPDSHLEQHDFRQPYIPEDYYDLVLSFEVAEHISEKYIRTLVSTLANSGEVVVLTAVPSEQGDTDGVNDRPDYWIRLFNDHRMEYDCNTTEELKEEITADSLCCDRQNLMVFKKAHS
jgi:cyclopropane fatty-acyl-phospholipid synthase-like methyltransferase